MQDTCIYVVSCLDILLMDLYRIGTGVLQHMLCPDGFPTWYTTEIQLLSGTSSIALYLQNYYEIVVSTF